MLVNCDCGQPYKNVRKPCAEGRFVICFVKQPEISRADGGCGMWKQNTDIKIWIWNRKEAAYEKSG